MTPQEDVLQHDAPQNPDSPPRDPTPNPKAGIASEVDAFDDPDSHDEDALPGHAGGGLAGA
ncbi:hypothetical protein LU699_01220 [Luteimonas fraxinea]|uniref:Uncharacterized protein n=1 Tax=Luteimonas fraxinea TaxID=2901869 RepID=A0ABS8UJ19_9GAMM|nr:hypothetical protein [Luteimonas fraxinea]MCD9098734.1 hypothetical protein [Luteimonas fraxinea]MCD9127521.1 hypothetical protein [Luteimonas fraxinea]UHH10390.1 hypothetical protein LU699_01220 [Luteimonas fraxinea]